MFNITHGVANSMLLPHVMRFNRDAIVGRLANVARALGLSAQGDDDAAAADSLLASIGTWTEVMAIPQDLRAFGVSEADVQPLAEAALKVKRLLGNNPKPLDLEDIKGIYKRLLP
jgi:alcohol dehydrogenase